MSSRHGRNWTERGVVANPRGFHKPEQNPAEQDKEREALSKTEAPFPIQTHPEDCPCPRCEDLRRNALRRAGLRIPGMSAKNEWGDEW